MGVELNGVGVELNGVGWDWCAVVLDELVDNI